MESFYLLPSISLSDSGRIPQASSSGNIPELPMYLWFPEVPLGDMRPCLAFNWKEHLGKHKNGFRFDLPS